MLTGGGGHLKPKVGTERGGPQAEGWNRVAQAEGGGRGANGLGGDGTKDRPYKNTTISHSLFLKKSGDNKEN